MVMAEWLHLPEGIESLTAGFIVLSALLTSLVGSVFGLGGGVILLALLAVLIPPAALIPVHGTVQLGSTAARAGLMLHFIRWPILLPFAIGTALGSALSGMLFIQLPHWLVQYLVAGFILWSVFGSIPAIGRRHIVVAGAFSGSLTMLFGSTGPFVSAFLKGMKLAPFKHVATHAALMSLQHALKVTVFLLLGFSFAPYVFLIAMMILAGIVGTWIGRSVLSRMSERNFKPALDTLLVLLAARLVWQATESALGI